MNKATAEIVRSIKTAERRLEGHRSACAHTRVSTVPHASLDHYDMPDRYWYTHTCRNCGHMWDTDQRTGKVIP